MNHNAKHVAALLLLSLALVLAGPGSVLPAQAGERIRQGEMAGYLIVPNEKVPETFNAGFSMYVAAWPLLKAYPGDRFQSGLFGTWMFAQYEGPRSRETVLRYRGRPGLVAGHAVRDRNAEVHHGRSGAEFCGMGQRSRRGERQRLARTRRQIRAWHNSRPGCCGRPTV